MEWIVMNKFKTLILLLTILASFVLTGCATYPLGSTKAEIWKARYEQNIVLDSDSTGTAFGKVTKRVLWDIFTLCFAEVHYAKIVRNHSFWLLKEREKNEAFMMKDNAADKLKDYFAEFIGVHQSEIIGKFGPADRVDDDGTGGRVLVYEEATDNSSSRFGIISLSSEVTQKTTIFRVWFAVDQSGNVRNAGARETSQSGNTKNVRDLK